MNTQCLLTINSKEQLIDFSPYRNLFIQLFQLLSYEPITDQQGNEAFDYAVSKHKEWFLPSHVIVALCGIASLMENYLTDQSIIQFENYPNRKSEAQRFLNTTFKTQQHKLGEPYYDLYTVFSMKKTATDELELQKFVILYEYSLKWYFFSKIIPPDLRSTLVTPFYTDAKNNKGSNQFETDKIYSTIRRIIGSTSVFNLDNPFDVKLALQKRVDETVFLKKLFTKNKSLKPIFIPKISSFYASLKLKRGA